MRLLKFLPVLCFVACGTSPTGPTPLPSASPVATPTPEPQLTVDVGIEAIQDGNVVEQVAANSFFSINATASICYLGGVQEDCPLIPFWIQSQTGGPLCNHGGNLNSAKVVYQCPTVGNNLDFQACAFDLNRTQLGCGQWTLLSVFDHGIATWKIRKLQTTTFHGVVKWQKGRG